MAQVGMKRAFGPEWIVTLQFLSLVVFRYANGPE